MVGWIWKGTLAILISIVGYFLKSWWQNRGKMDAVDLLTEQITRLISAQAETSETRDVTGHPQVPSVEELDEPTDNIRSTHREAA